MVNRIEKSVLKDRQHHTTSSTISFGDTWETTENEFELHRCTNCQSKSQNAMEIKADQ